MVITVTQRGPGAAPRIMRPLWSRWRYWLALLVALVLAAVVVGLLGQTPGRPLDPASAQQDGSKALAQVLAGYGIRVERTTDPAPGGDVVVTEPDAFSSGQLRRLAARSDRVVLVQPGLRATRAVLPVVEPDTGGGVSGDPGCSVAGAVAAGTVDLPDDAVPYTRAGPGGIERCYGGALVVGDRVAILGSSQVLENRALARRGVAALAVNTVSDDRRATSVRWLLPGAAAKGAGQVTIWTLFPPGAHRVAIWLLVVALAAVVWRARRLGPAVREPLPVVVRSAEIVEGHGRLYEQAHARDRAAVALRAATARRLTKRLALPRGSTPTELAAAVSARLRSPAADIWALLAGPPPVDDLELTRLARELERLEAALLKPSPGEDLS